MAQATRAPSEATFGIFEWQRDYALKTLDAYKTAMEGHVLGSSFFCVHSFWRKFRACFRLSGCHDAAAEEIETGATVHGALDDFQSVDLALNRTGAPGQRQGGMDGFDILTEAPREAFEGRCLRRLLIQPSSWSASPCLIMVEKVFGQIDRLGDRRRQLEQRRREPALLRIQLVRFAHQHPRRFARRGRRCGLRRGLGGKSPFDQPVVSATPGGPLLDDTVPPDKAPIADLTPQPGGQCHGDSARSDSGDDNLPGCSRSRMPATSSQPAVIQHAVWLYLRFTLSYRDVEEPAGGARTGCLLRDNPALGRQVRSGDRAEPAAASVQAQLTLACR